MEKDNYSFHDELKIGRNISMDLHPTHSWLSAPL